jgi:superfamily II DNA or RNA helicase
MKAQEGSLARSIFDFLSEEDWDYGLDLHHSGKVSHFHKMESLITAHVQSNDGKEEVRLKIHPAGHQIQWIECTCRKSRLKSKHCEHMAAVLFHMDKDLAAEFQSISIKPQAKRKERDRDNKQSIAQQILLQYEDNIVHVKHQTANGNLSVEFDDSKLSDVTLSIDESALFLASFKRKKCLDGSLKGIKIFDEPVWEFGVYLSEDDRGHLTARRALIRPKNKRQKVLDFGELNIMSMALKVDGKDEEINEIVTIKDLDGFRGRKYIYVPHQGYFAYNCTAELEDSALDLSFTDEEYAEVVAGGFKRFKQRLFIDNKVSTEVIRPKLAEINVISEESGWFVLDPQYGDGAYKVSMLDLLRKHKLQKKNFQKVGKVWFEIPELIKNFEWSEEDKHLKVDTLGMFRLQAALGEFDQLVGRKEILDKLRQQTRFDNSIEAPVLEESKLSLRPYQHEGYQWLYWLYKNKLHGLLADDMGLGKTHQTMALITGTFKEGNKYLIVCPTTVIDHWEDKLREFCPQLRVQRHHGPSRSLEIRQNDVIITSYGILLRDVEILRKIEWEIICLDEAHLIKNSKTGSYQAVCLLPSRMRLCLSGTPLENDLIELKNLFDFLLPGYLGSDRYFKKMFYQKHQQELQRLIHPFKLRRRKKEVLSDLPEKTEDIWHCSLSEEQVAMYRNMIEQKSAPLLQQLKDDQQKVSYLHVFTVLSYLKQICNHPALLHPGDDFENHKSGKFELLKELIAEALSSDHKIVIYSQYLLMIEFISQYLKRQDIKHVVLTGQTQKRGEVVKKFQNDPEIKVFVGSLLAGGLGIDLTAASVVIHYDRWWNASKENQATDRVHRIGQNRNVFVYKLVTRGTLEEKIDAMIRRKQELFETYLEKDEDFFKSLSRSELIDLLSGV